MTELAGGPSTAAERIEAMDVVRGVALFGILLMNITGIGLPWAYNDPTNWGGAEGANLWSWIIIQMGFEGTQRGLFSLLFGAGVILFTSRLEARGRTDVADIYFRRNLWLVAFGVIHCFLLLWIGDILFFYGITSLFVFAFRKMAPRPLILIALAGLLFSAGWSLIEARGTLEAAANAAEADAIAAGGGDLTEEQVAAQESWAAIVGESKPGEEALAEEVELYVTGSYFDIVVHQAPVGSYFESWFIYRNFFDYFSMMLIGMAFFKMGVLTLELRSRTYLAMMVGGWALGLGINYLEVSTIMADNFSVQSFAQAQLTYDLGRLSMVVGHLGALLLFCRSGVLGFLRRSLAAVGRMALTNYISHTIICGFIFFGYGLGLYGQLERHQLYFVVFAIWVVQLVISPLWLGAYRFGPLEWGWRALTYGARPVFRRKGPAVPPAPAE